MTSLTRPLVATALAAAFVLAACSSTPGPQPVEPPAVKTNRVTVLPPMPPGMETSGTAAPDTIKFIRIGAELAAYSEKQANRPILDRAVKAKSVAEFCQIAMILPRFAAIVRLAARYETAEMLESLVAGTQAGLAKP